MEFLSQQGEGLTSEPEVEARFFRRLANRDRREALLLSDRCRVRKADAFGEAVVAVGTSSAGASGELAIVELKANVLVNANNQKQNKILIKFTSEPHPPFFLSDLDQYLIPWVFLTL